MKTANGIGLKRPGRLRAHREIPEVAFVELHS
jgi:hypothetical protein